MGSKQEFVRHAIKDGVNFKALCERFRISRKTGYKWLKRYQVAGDAGLVEHSRRPKQHPLATPNNIIELVLKARDQHPAWGGRKLHAWLKNKGHTNVPCPSIITKLLQQNGYIQPANYQKETAWQRFEHERPNDLWQMDFKGHVGMHNGQRCHPLTILDDHSRFSVGLKATTETNAEIIQHLLSGIFECYGLPLGMNMDNGPPWGSAHSRYTRLSLWLMRLGIRVSFSRFQHPQTNGKDERFHRTLKAELLNYHTFEHLEDAQNNLDIWRDCYNHERAHESLGLKPPITRYQPSVRAFPSVLPPIEYAPDDIVRKVTKAGYIRFNKQSWYIGEGFIGLPVGVRQSRTEQDSVGVYFCNTRVKILDLKTSEN